MVEATVWEILGDVAAMAAGGPLRAARARRAERRLRAGRPVRIPCAVRPDDPDRASSATAGRLLLTPGRAGILRARRSPVLVVPPGGTLHVPEPGARSGANWSAAVYRPPGGGRPVHLRIPAHYLPVAALGLVSRFASDAGRES